MNTSTITVYYHGISLLVCTEVADDLGLKPGHHIRTDDEFRYILGQNASMMIAKCEIEFARQRT